MRSAVGQAAVFIPSDPVYLAPGLKSWFGFLRKVCGGISLFLHFTISVDRDYRQVALSDINLIGTDMV